MIFTDMTTGIPEKGNERPEGVRRRLRTSGGTETATLVKIVDLLGRETHFKPNTPLIYIYSDGKMERVFKLEE